MPDVLTDAEEEDLLGRLATLPFHEVRMRGVAARRTVVHYGWDYGYESWRVTPTDPLPAFLEPLQARAAALAGVEPAALEQVLVARYPPGAGIGWHRDAPMFGPVVVAVSLGSAAVLRFRRGPGPGAAIAVRDDAPQAAGRRSVAGRSRRARMDVRVPIAPRSAYVLAGAARAAWQHSIPPVRALRYSVSFRTLRRGAVSRPPAG